MEYGNKRRAILAVSVLILGLLYAFKNMSFFVRALSAIGLLSVFYIIDHYFDMNFKAGHYFIILFIAIIGFLLSPLYFIYPQYDKILHLVNPALFGVIVFYMVSKLKLKLKWKLVFVFFVIAGTVGLLEIGEYLLDYFFNLKLQGVFLRNLQGLQKFDILLGRIDDTMVDMSLGFIGAFSYVCFVGVSSWVKGKKKK